MGMHSWVFTGLC